MALNGILQYITSAGEIANSTLARLGISLPTCQDKGGTGTYPVDKRPMQMIHWVGTFATSHATRTLHSIPDTAVGRNRNMA